MKFRKEFDSIGSINVPNDKYWGASTQRSKKYFDIGEFLVRPILIKSIAIIKKAENIAKTAFNVDTQPPDVPQQVEVLAHDLTPQNTEAHFNLGEQMEVDLGQGLKGKINISGLET